MRAGRAAASITAAATVGSCERLLTEAEAVQVEPAVLPRHLRDRGLVGLVKLAGLPLLLERLPPRGEASLERVDGDRDRLVDRPAGDGRPGILELVDRTYPAVLDDALDLATVLGQGGHDPVALVVLAAVQLLRVGEVIASESRPGGG